MLKKSLIVLIIVTGIAYAYLLWPWIMPWLLSNAQVSLAADPIPDNTNSPAVVVNAMITPPPRFQETELTLTAAPNAIGWATDLGGRGYLAEPEIMAGSFDGNTFMGALQFDLSAVPAGAMITYADLQLTGRNGQSLQPNGKWELQLLASAVDAVWSTLNYNALHQAAIETTVGQQLTSADLAEGQVNSFRFDVMQLRLLQSHLNNGVVSFRLTGPATTAGDNIFTWRGVVDGSTAENQPQLHLRFTPGDDVGPRTGSVAVDTLPPDFIVKVSTPTVTSQPATSTPLPKNIITVTAETAPATEMAAAIDIFTPVPENRSTPTSTATPSPTTLAAVLVTRTPTPENVITMAAQAAQATAIATAVGTYTPEPRNWVFPVVVTPEPAPANQATATFRVAAATAEAFLSGATPRYVWTATPTPFMKSVTGDVATPWAATPTPTPPSIPQQLVGKIAFLSNRSGGPEPLRNPLVYVVDPDGSNLAVLTEDTFYKLAEQRDMLSADQRFRTFVKEFPRYIGESGQHQMVPAIFFYDYEYNAEEQITFFGAGDAWDPVWSPGREQIAFVSNDSQDDEIWIVNRDGSGLRRLTETNEGFNAREIGKDTFVPEINGHPSWSPDGNQIVFTSTRSGHRQIWVMDADGNNLFSLSTTGYDDWNPVWIKYTDHTD